MISSTLKEIADDAVRVTHGLDPYGTGHDFWNVTLDGRWIIGTGDKDASDAIADRLRVSIKWLLESLAADGRQA